MLCNCCWLCMIPSTTVWPHPVVMAMHTPEVEGYRYMEGLGLCPHVAAVCESSFITKYILSLLHGMAYLGYHAVRRIHQEQWYG